MRVPDVGEGDSATRFVLDMRAATASESLDESSSDDAEPDIESSRPEKVKGYKIVNLIYGHNIPSTRCAKSVSVTALPPFNRTLTLYRCQSDL